MYHCYSQEDLTVLKNNYQQIERYITKKYFPKLVPGETVTVFFNGGDLFCFNNMNIWVCCGGPGALFFNPTSGGGNIYEMPEHADELIFHWDFIKERIKEYFDNRAKRKVVIRSFRV